MWVVVLPRNLRGAMHRIALVGALLLLRLATCFVPTPLFPKSSFYCPMLPISNKGKCFGRSSFLLSISPSSSSLSSEVNEGALHGQTPVPAQSLSDMTVYTQYRKDNSELEHLLEPIEGLPTPMPAAKGGYLQGKNLTLIYMRERMTHCARFFR